MSTELIHMPLFPLGVFLLPGERIPLHIFEPRYRQMFAEIEQESLEFGIPFSVGRLTMSLGSRCKLIRVVKKYEGGESDVLIECNGIFRLKQYQSSKEDKPYPFGSVDMMPHLMRAEVGPTVIEAYEEYSRFVDESGAPFEHPSEMKLIPILASLRLRPEEKMSLLNVQDAEKRDERVCRLIRFNRLILEQEIRVENGLYLN